MDANNKISKVCNIQCIMDLFMNQNIKIKVFCVDVPPFILRFNCYSLNRGCLRIAHDVVLMP
jgi:hypothetical protein